MRLELCSGPPHVQCRTRARTGELKLAYWADSKCLDAQQYGDIDFVGDVRDIDKFIAPESCSEIIWVHGPEHTPYHEHAPMFRKILAALKPGGVVRLAMPDIRAITTRLFNWDSFSDGHFLDFRWRMYGQAEVHDRYQVHFSGWWDRYTIWLLEGVGFERVRIVPNDEWWTSCPPTNMNAEAFRPL